MDHGKDESPGRSRDGPLERSAKSVLREDSDRLLRAVGELRALERQKRAMEISSEPFHELARQVEEKAREVFRLAEAQQIDGEVVDRLEETQGDGTAGTIEEAPRPAATPQGDGAGRE
jgi:signal transduction histidine kinase